MTEQHNKSIVCLYIFRPRCGVLRGAQGRPKGPGGSSGLRIGSRTSDASPRRPGTVEARRPDRIDGKARAYEPKRQGAVTPGVFEHMTPVRPKDHAHPQGGGRFDEGSSLVARGCGQEQEVSALARQVRQTCDFKVLMGTNWSPVGSAQQYQGSDK